MPVGHDGERIDGKQPECADAREQADTSSTGKISSPNVPATAASAGESSGTWYSLRNNSSVTSQLVSLSQPDLRNCQLTQSRVSSSSRERRWSSARASWVCQSAMTASPLHGILPVLLVRLTGAQPGLFRAGWCSRRVCQISQVAGQGTVASGSMASAQRPLASVRVTGINYLSAVGYRRFETTVGLSLRPCMKMQRRPADAARRAAEKLRGTMAANCGNFARYVDTGRRERCNCRKCGASICRRVVRRKCAA